MGWRHESEKEEVRWEKGLGLGGGQAGGVIRTQWPDPLYSRFQEVKGGLENMPRKQRREVVPKNTGSITASFCNPILFCD